VKAYPSDRIRNVALVGHGGSGKTMLAEAFLFASGGTTRMGRIEDGSTVSDFEPEETKKTISVSTSVVPVEWNGYKVNVLDAPGYADFVGEAHAALSVCDLALFVVSAVEGIEVQTELLWQRALAHSIPRMIVINKMDRERASYERTLSQIREVFGNEVAPLQTPIGEEASFEGVSELLSGLSYIYSGSPKGNEKAAEGDDDLRQLRQQLVEAVAESDDALLERYLEGEELTPKELTSALGKGVAAGAVSPVLCVSATKLIGVDRLAEVIVGAAPSPLDRPSQVAEDGAEIEANPSAPVVLWVWKTLADQFVGKISYFRVAAGTLKRDDQLTNTTRHEDEKLHQIFVPRGKEHIDIDALPAGDIGAVAKLGDTQTGDTLCDKSRRLTLPHEPPPDPVLSVAIFPKTKGDEDKLSTALHRIADEDPSIRITRSDETKQTLLQGMGEAHLDVTLERIHRKFGVEIVTKTPRIPYRETIAATAEGEGKYKKQTGGHGQFGIASLRVEPLPRGSGFEFVDAIVGGVIPRQFIPAVEKGVVEATQRGFYAGYPLVDIRVTCFDGKHHPVDSSELSFKMAGSLGLQVALEQAQVTLLEPIAELLVIVPNTYSGDVMGDLNSKRGRIMGMEPLAGGNQLIKATVPLSEVARYAIDLRSITGGRGAFTISISHYEEVPTHIAEKVKAEAAKAKEEADGR
jgi:elongation factor G